MLGLVRRLSPVCPSKETPSSLNLASVVDLLILLFYLAVAVVVAVVVAIDSVSDSGQLHYYGFDFLHYSDLVHPVYSSISTIVFC